MNDDTSFRAWALEQWQREAIKRTPLGRSIRNAKVRDRALKLEHKAMLRSLAAQSGAKTRKLRKKLATDAEVLREKRVVQDAGRERRLWDFLLHRG